MALLNGLKNKIYFSKLWLHYWRWRVWRHEGGTEGRRKAVRAYMRWQHQRQHQWGWQDCWHGEGE